MSYIGWLVNRLEAEPITFEATFSNHYVAEEVREARNEGFDVEMFDGDSIRIVYLYSEWTGTPATRKPLVYREFNPVGQEED